MSTGSPVRALAWKEARELCPIVAGGLAGLVLLTLALAARNPQVWSYILVVFLAPGAAAVMGGVSMSGDGAGGTRAFLLARAVSERTILGVKSAAHALGALLLSATALGIGSFIGLGDQGWCTPLQTSAGRTWLFGLALLPVAFGVGVVISWLLPDSLAAAAAAPIVAAFWTLAIVYPAMRLGGSVDTAFEELPYLLSALLLGAAAMVLVVGDRKGLLARTDGRPARHVRALAFTLGLLSGGLFIRALTHEPVQARMVLAGSASVVGDDIVSDARGGVVAFVASPESGRARAVVSLVDERRVVSLAVLAPGTKPIGWSEEHQGFVIEWPDGARRLVSPAGEIRPLSPDELDLWIEPGPFIARGGALVRRGPGGDVVAFPRQESRP